MEKYERSGIPPWKYISRSEKFSRFDIMRSDTDITIVEPFDRFLGSIISVDNNNWKVPNIDVGVGERCSTRAIRHVMPGRNGLVMGRVEI